MMQTAMRQPEQLEGHQLGQLTVAASHPGPLLPVLAGEDPVRAGAAQGSANSRPADQQAGGAVEGDCWGIHHTFCFLNNLWCDCSNINHLVIF